jgi:regulator of sigma E protease
VLRRHGRLLTEAVTPRYNVDAHRQLVGFTYEPNIVNRSVSATRAASLTITGLWNVTEQTVSRIGKVFQSKDRKQIHGVVGGYTVVQKSFAKSPSVALEVLALISLSLAVINLFPFLPLDGGHIFWAVAEKLRGKRIPFAVMERAGLIGFALIIGLFVVGLTNDISTLSGKGFNVP